MSFYSLIPKEVLKRKPVIGSYRVKEFNNEYWIERYVEYKEKWFGVITIRKEGWMNVSTYRYKTLDEAMGMMKKFVLDGLKKAPVVKYHYPFEQWFKK